MTQVFSWNHQQLGRKQELDKRIDQDLPSKWGEGNKTSPKKLWGLQSLRVVSFIIQMASSHNAWHFLWLLSCRSDSPEKVLYLVRRSHPFRGQDNLFISSFCLPFYLCSLSLFHLGVLWSPSQCLKSQWDQPPIRVLSQIYSLLNCIFLS